MKGHKRFFSNSGAFFFFKGAELAATRQRLADNFPAAAGGFMNDLQRIK